jgi:VIT1/CCC1 family predicted Fe2+/Mn2+ transporter
MIAFPTGSVLPLLSITLFPDQIRIVATFIAVVVALTVTGYAAAALGKSNRWRSVLRNVVSGILTMIITYFIGSLFAH